MCLKLDTGLLTGAPAGTVATLQAVQQLLETMGGEARPAAPAGEAGAALLFDVSDMFGYFPDNRLPTGVQRVQINVILTLLDTPGDHSVALVRFVEGRDEWVAVPIAPFREVCRLSMADGDTVAPDWRSAVAELERAVARQPVLTFPRGAWLVGLGTSWWLPNYFMYVRQAKVESGIRYVPLIYDMIPAMRAEDCHPELVHEFIDWLIGVLQHADFFLAISDATKADLIALAAELGMPVPPDNIAVVPLHAELNRGRQTVRNPAMLSKWGLKPGSFVLLVSTLEVRKNQVGAFDAWQRLIGIHGKERVPQLVCVGKRGYRNERVLARRDASADLQDKVLILERVDDAELEALYQHCLLTVYPSSYEGWGLPVTESLSYGKVPLTADNSSLPQAGEGLSVMFETGSPTAFLTALERLIYEPAYRKEKEAAIARGFVSRGWGDVAGDMSAKLGSFARRADAGSGDWAPMIAEPGYYPMIRNRETQLRDGMGSVETYRYETGWWRLEDHGCWSRPGGGALRMVRPEGVRRLALELVGLPSQRATFTIETNDRSEAITGSISADARKWVFIDVADEGRPTETIIRLTSHLTEIVTEAAPPHKSREIGIGLAGFFVFEPHNPRARLDFVEAVALGGLANYRRVAPARSGR